MTKQPDFEEGFRDAAKQALTFITFGGDTDRGYLVFNDDASETAGEAAFAAYMQKHRPLPTHGA